MHALRNVAPCGCALPGGRRIPCDVRGGDGRQGHHANERDTGQDVAGTRPSARHEREGEPERDGRESALPDEVKEGPAGHVDHGSPLRVHRVHLSPSSSSCRICASSSGELFLVESACMTSFKAEPPYARSSRSCSSWRWVCSS